MNVENSGERRHASNGEAPASGTITSTASRNKRNARDKRISPATLALALLCCVLTSPGRGDELPAPPAQDDSSSQATQESAPPPTDASPTDDASPPPVDATNPDEAAPQETTDTSDLPDIEARLYRVRTETVSHSGNVYLLKRLSVSEPQDAPAETIPPERKLLMLKSGDDNVMALRVMKIMPQSDHIVAKRIRNYSERYKLPMSEEYVAVEKISDRMPPPPTEQDKKDIQEVAPEEPPKPPEEPAKAEEPPEKPAKVEEPPPPEEPPAPEPEELPKPFDTELDSATSPAPDSNPETTQNKNDSDEIDENALGRAIEDTESNDTHRNWLSLELGLLRGTPTGPTSFALYSAGGFRYEYDFFQHIFFLGGQTFDALGLEGGLFFYKVVNLQPAGGDSYTIVPLSVVVRYTVFLSDAFGISTYGGLMKNFVLSDQAPTGVPPTDPNFQQTVINLGSVVPAFGFGATYRIGPGWYIRADLGTDMLAVGVSLRF